MGDMAKVIPKSPVFVGCLLLAVFLLGTAFRSDPGALSAAFVALSLDPPIPGAAEMIFDNPGNFWPESSNLQLLSFATLSNVQGERWALLSIDNPQPGKVELENGQVMAIMADGTRLRAQNLGIRLSSRQTTTLSVFFGVHKFPIVRVVMGS